MPGKFKIVVSDLHLSGGYPDVNPLEDFASDQEFADFLADIATESDLDGADVELIVNGDTFEMLQVPSVEDFDPATAYPSRAYHSSSERDSVRKMAIVIDGHRQFFEALARFIRLGPPRRWVTLVNGNHDVNLYWPSVQASIADAIGAVGRRSGLLTFESRCVNREGIYVEHGNQYAELIDRLDNMDDPLHPTRPGQLAIPLGSWFVMDVFNKVERSRYWIDGVKPITALIWYALAFDFGFAARAIAVLIRALPGIIDHAFLDVSESEGSRMAALEDLARRLEDPAQVEVMAVRYRADESFRSQFNTEISEFLAPPPAEVPGADLMALARVADPVEMGEKIRTRVRSSLYNAAFQQAREKSAGVVVFGHTHQSCLEILPGGGTYINCGTWTWRANFAEAGKETWLDLFEHPERFTNDRLLTYARIDYDDADYPIGRLLACQSGDSHLPVPLPSRPALLWIRFVSWLRGIAQRLSGNGGQGQE